MGLNPAEKDFALKHYSTDEVVKLSYATEAFDAFDNKFIYPYNSIYLGKLLRTDASIAKQHQEAIDSLLPFKNNLIAKCLLARLYALKYEYYSFQQALEYVQEGAEAGLAEAQWIYGKYLIEENPKAYNDALYWLRQASDQGHSIATCQMGIIYDHMYYDSDINIQQAKEYLALAKRYYREAETHQGMYHLAKNAFIHDANAAYAKKILEAIVDRYPLANMGLGLLYYNTKSPYLNYQKAYSYFRICKNWGYWTCYEMIAEMYKCGKISGGESADYWIKLAIEHRNNRKDLLYERDFKVPSPSSVLPEVRDVYNKLGFYDLPQKKESFNGSSGAVHSFSNVSSSKQSSTPVWSKVFGWIFWIVIAVIVFKICS